ncbi:MAG: hypothetical protein QMC77_01640 [Methanocellales archaeon]|nr:hypothetical protein [Methanocellales archaeon]
MRKIPFVLMVVFIVILLQTLVFYRGMYFAPPTNLQDVRDINISSHVLGEFIDVYEKGDGTVLFDFSHDNNFEPEELNVLASRIISRGYSVEYLKGNKSLEEELEHVDSFVVILPVTPFSEEEIDQVKNFVDGGGKLLMIADPTRDSEINALSSNFGIIFWNDYLYNLKDNEGNFQYIYLSDFKENSITKDLDRVVFYVSSSIYPSEEGIMFTDENTYSSSKGIKGKYSPMVLTDDSKVLAISDLTFLTEPYNVLDNNQLISNIADYLTSSS